MKLKRKISIIALAILLFNCRNNNEVQASNKSNVAVLLETSKSHPHPTKNAEIVFCLDATGSMGGLIGTAKEKIWDIVSELAQDGDIDTLKLGMVFYRDRGDSFVTKQIAMTTDLDDVYSELLEIGAAGGGDSPESVNQGLYEAITQMQWSSDKKTYRTVFVVGDCPPHMDYQDDVKYTESCKLATKKGITINTIKLGNACREAIPHFRNMASCTNGEFLMLDQNAKDYVVATPYDDEINRLSRNIDDTRMYYGDKELREVNYSKKAKSMAVYDSGSTTANSARAEYKQSKTGQKVAYGTQEIISDYDSGKLNLEEIEDDKLPENLKGKSLEEKEIIVKEQSEKRKVDNTKLKDLLKKKREYINKKASEETDKPSFSKDVLKVMKKQANKKAS
ncbi:vWA domain-containing protein [Winogradskyella jejuensis]|uniref:von Willebrand factor type A domain-containing protein n=1 Tax=Winogradskyella jejuensis TaxID=1089305 RepID=A0A1M5TZH8_9FLAO|nr:vWA domain-containing protein [Winogradskyella jejuensis]SHH56094.1 von Willebrand factor type A domain-containing protein [Winogradskyella jejuensis]